MGDTGQELLAAAQIIIALKSHKRSKVVELLRRGALPATGAAIEAWVHRLEHLSALGTATLTFHQTRFPTLLREIPDPPLVLHVQGQLGSLEQRAVAIVGSRRASANGVLMARECACALARHGVVVVSGLASGIDAAAHEGALEAGGTTVGVLGSGLDRIYPSHHRSLAKRIVDSGGALVSEYSPETTAQKHFFPERNRIISGLSEAVLVVEASLRSGSLITARMALEQGRDVFAVPGSVFADNSRGCHRLIREGAALVDCVETLLDELHIPDAGPPQTATSQTKGTTQGTTKGTTLLGALSEVTPQSPEELAGKLSCSMQEILLGLLDLEARGIVVLSDGGYIRLPPA